MPCVCLVTLTNIYAREGVGYLWFVDPDGRTLEAFELKDGKWVLIASLANADTVSVPPFDAISFPLSNLWP
ncbi:Uma2 family endonuclease [Ruegeria sp.]|uniref:Uma2 family endonuclease n=1 Tax=Ruegeria sp. TaxID=1879320 RepID=UPI003AFFEA2D